MKENTHADEAEVKSTHQELATCSNTACLSLVPWRQFFLSWPALHYLSIWSVKSLLGWIDLCFPLFLVILQIHLANSSLGPHFRSPIPSLSFLRNSLGKYNHVSSSVFMCPLCSSPQHFFSNLHDICIGNVSAYMHAIMFFSVLAEKAHGHDHRRSPATSQEFTALIRVIA